jgi:hypothetical protein
MGASGAALIVSGCINVDVLWNGKMRGGFVGIEIGTGAGLLGPGDISTTSLVSENDLFALVLLMSIFVDFHNVEFAGRSVDESIN